MSEPARLVRRIGIRTRCLDCDRWHLHEYEVPMDAEIPNWLAPLLHDYPEPAQAAKK